MGRKKFKLANCACSVFRHEWEQTTETKWDWTVLKPPQTTVVVHYRSYTPTCVYLDHCAQLMHQLLRKYRKQQGLPDIPYNFVVAEEGEAYCARGWKKQSDPSLPYPELLGKKIDILLFGDWTNTEPPQKMCDKLAELIDYGVKYKRIAKDYELLTVDNNLWDGYLHKYSDILNNFKT